MGLEFACPACAGTAATRRAERRVGDCLFHLVQCDTCGLYGASPLPHEDLAELSDRTTGEWYPECQDDVELDADERDRALALSRRRVADLEGRVSGRRLLDIGTGKGYIVAAAQERGWEARGIETSRPAIEFARQHLGVELHWGVWEQRPFAGETFSVVRLRHVLEHLHDPAGALAWAGEIMEPQGLLALEVPNAEALIYALRNLGYRARGQAGRRHACGVDPPGHLWGFTCSTLSRLLGRVGFEAVELRAVGLGDPLHYPMVWSRLNTRRRMEWALDRAGCVFGRGSLLVCYAREK